MIVGAAAAQAWAGPQDANTLVVDPRPRFELSSYLYMQFIEPLGTTDSSVEAAWDLLADDWRKDVFDAIQDLAPPMLRFGGNLSDYYRWREAVGPRAQRVPLVNQEWGGIESNQVGTREFVQLCQRVGAEPLMCVNFESDGRTKYRLARGSLRVGDAAEAAAWVAYCNQPHNADPLLASRQRNVVRQGRLRPGDRRAEDGRVCPGDAGRGSAVATHRLGRHGLDGADGRSGRRRGADARLPPYVQSRLAQAASARR
jgi:hypothetical protein